MLDVFDLRLPDIECALTAHNMFCHIKEDKIVCLRQPGSMNLDNWRCKLFLSH